MKLSKKELNKALDEMVKKGYLKKMKIKGEVCYMDSNKVTSLLKSGKTRKQIAKVLEKGDA